MRALFFGLAALNVAAVVGGMAYADIRHTWALESAMQAKLTAQAERRAAHAPETLPPEQEARLALRVAQERAMLARKRRHALWTAGAFGLLTGGCWLGAGWWASDRRRRAEALARASALQPLAQRATSHFGAFEGHYPPWRVACAHDTLPGEAPGGAFVTGRALSPTRLGLFLGAANGAGAASAWLKGVGLALWRARASAQETPGETLLAVNAMLGEFLLPGDLLTGAYARVDAVSGEATYALAGHRSVFHLSQRGVASLDGGGKPLGVGPELFDDRLKQGTLRLALGESLWLCSPGLLKLRNAQGEAFGLARWEGCLQSVRDFPAEQAVSYVRREIDTFSPPEERAAGLVFGCLRLDSAEA